MKKDSAMFWGTCANSSKKITLKELPRTALEEVAAAITLLPFSTSILPLLDVTTPCCKNLGKCSYASCNLERSSLATAPLLARIATLTLSLNKI